MQESHKIVFNFLSCSFAFYKDKKDDPPGVHGEQKNLLHRFVPRTGAKGHAADTNLLAPVRAMNWC
jgi:hypothetical protein